MTEFIYEVTDVAATAGPTPSQTVGPFFGFALPYDTGPDVVGAHRPGRIRLFGGVYDGAGAGVPDALVELWQPDESGSVARNGGVHAETSDEGFRGFGRCGTDDDGGYAFHTVKPGRIGVHSDAAVSAEPAASAASAPYAALAVFARGMLRPAFTRVYFPDDDLAGDPLLESLPSGRRDTLVAAHVDDGYRFDVHLQGDEETVFLDVFTC